MSLDLNIKATWEKLERIGILIAIHNKLGVLGNEILAESYASLSFVDFFLQSFTN